MKIVLKWLLLSKILSDESHLFSVFNFQHIHVKKQLFLHLVFEFFKLNFLSNFPRLTQNSLTFWHNFKIPWLFPDWKNFANFARFSSASGNLGFYIKQTYISSGVRTECGTSVHRLPWSIPANKRSSFLQEKYILSPGQLAKNKNHGSNKLLAVVLLLQRICGAANS